MPLPQRRKRLHYDSRDGAVFGLHAKLLKGTTDRSRVRMLSILIYKQLREHLEGPESRMAVDYLPEAADVDTGKRSGPTNSSLC